MSVMYLTNTARNICIEYVYINMTYKRSRGLGAAY